MDLAQRIRQALAAVSDPDKAPAMQAYMKSQMPFLGVQKQPRTQVLRPLLRGVDDQEAIPAARQLWDEAEYREHRYAALALLRGRVLDEDLVRHLIVTGAWWDYVDEIATKLLPTGIDLRAWAVDHDMWIRRAAILSQVGDKTDTDADLLRDVIEVNSRDRRFWITKAIGWALRDYARTDPQWVRDFVTSHDLAPLSVREATKHL
jgi:3-methyladenine DNA glycosylase AlkD